jgi:predicted nucleic acid-binding protein
LIVADASAVVDVLLRTDDPGPRERILRPRQTIHCPHLVDLEVAQTLRRFVLAGEMDGARGLAALGDLAALRIVRHPHEPFLERVWELRGNVSVHDAIYVALAEALGAPLVTRDARLAAAPGVRASVEVV